MFEIRKREIEGVTILTLQGELDQVGLKDLRMYLMNLRDEEDVTKVLLKMSRITSIRYSILPQMDKMVREATQSMHIGISGLSPSVAKTIEKSTFYKLLHVYDNEETAIESLK